MKKFALTRGARSILQIGLAPVALTFIYIAFTRSSLEAYDAARLLPSLFEQLEHAVMSLTLVICGALLFDIALVIYICLYGENNA